MKRPLVVALLFVLLWGLGLATRSITRPDEGRYAEIAREMAVSGDWITPRLNGIPYFEKPPLQYWATAESIQLLGPTALAARLWTALMGLLGVWVVWRTGDRLFGHGSGKWAALVLISSLYYAVLGHINSLDMGVSVWMTLSVCAFLLAQVEDRRWMMLAWAGTAAAVLSKGLMALAIPGGALILYFLWTRDTSPWRRLDPIRGVLIFLALGAPWFLLCGTQHPEFFHFFFIHEHFERFTSTVHNRAEPFWYFIPILLAGLLPWTGLLYTSVIRPLRGFHSRTFSPQRFLALYALFVLLFFSLSESKLPSYILPAFPAVALLMGRTLAQRPGMSYSPLWLGLLWAGTLAFAAAVLRFPDLAAQWGIHPDIDEDLVEPYRQFATWILSASVAMIIGVCLALRWRDQTLKALTALALTSLIAVQTLMQGSETLSDVTSSHRIAMDYAAEFKAASHIYSIGTYDQTLDYYLHRTVVLVAFQDELAFGLTLEPWQAIPTLNAFRNLWLNEPGARAIMAPPTFELLAASGVPMRMIFRDPRRVIVARI
ncbi:MAG: glycosyltransferase family 39 protein [Betaproteobacteria bacterium]|nr:glycosyltransferase family 39 protein [Betaproteobacteria bacterium]